MQSIDAVTVDARPSHGGDLAALAAVMRESVYVTVLEGVRVSPTP